MPKEWNHTGVPLAFLITFRCYGTWLHGHERGSVDRDHNEYGSARLPESRGRSNYVRKILIGSPVRLDTRRRNSVAKAIRETCKVRGWTLYALNVRTNHVHVVVGIGFARPEQPLTAFKANATRQMRADGCWTHGHSPWVAKGSKRYLWTEDHMLKAIDYVVNSQGGELPTFE